MSHVVVAELTDQQFAKLEQAQIPYVEIPDEIVQRFRALAPVGTSVEALIRVVKVYIANGELQVFDQAEGQSKEQRVRNKKAALAAELGL